MKKEINALGKKIEEYKDIIISTLAIPILGFMLLGCNNESNVKSPVTPGAVPEPPKPLIYNEHMEATPNYFPTANPTILPPKPETIPAPTD